MLKDEGKQKRKKLDYKCSNRICKKRYSIAELIELGYAERIDRDNIAIECPSCGNREEIKYK